MALTFKRLPLLVIYFSCRVSIGVALPIGHSLATRDVETSIHPADFGPELHPRQPTDSREGETGPNEIYHPGTAYIQIPEAEEGAGSEQNRMKEREREARKLRTDRQRRGRLDKRNKAKEQQKKEDEERRKTMGPENVLHAAGTSAAGNLSKEAKQEEARERKKEKQRNRKEAAKKKKEEAEEARRSKMAPEQSLHSSHPVSHHDEPSSSAAHTPTQAPTGVTTIDPSHLSSMAHGDAAEHLQPPAGGFGVAHSSTQHQSQLPPFPSHPAFRDDTEETERLKNAPHSDVRTYPFSSKAHSEGAFKYPPLEDP